MELSLEYHLAGYKILPMLEEKNPLSSLHSVTFMFAHLPFSILFPLSNRLQVFLDLWPSLLCLVGLFLVGAQQL